MNGRGIVLLTLRKNLTKCRSANDLLVFDLCLHAAFPAFSFIIGSIIVAANARLGAQRLRENRVLLIAARSRTSHRGDAVFHCHDLSRAAGVRRHLTVTPAQQFQERVPLHHTI